MHLVGYCSDGPAEARERRPSASTERTSLISEASTVGVRMLMASLTGNKFAFIPLTLDWSKRPALKLAPLILEQAIN
jgi:hypothetical protein